MSVNDENNKLLTSSGRPRRRTTLHVDYKEKRETDIPLLRVHTASKHVNSKRSRGAKSHSIGSHRISSSHNGSSRGNSSSSSIEYIPVDEIIPYNWQPKIRTDDDFNYIPTMKGAKIRGNTLKFKDGVKISKGDCIYMICEPPSEPFYLAMVTGFINSKNKQMRATDYDTSMPASDFMFEVLWFYRPRDISRHSIDSRFLFATVHKDLCPIQSFRGFVTIKHASEIEDMKEYKKQKNCFYYEKLYDRYMMKTYDMIPTKEMTNLPPNYYKALNKRFSFIFLENGHGENLLAEPQNCEKCHQWCPTSDSIQCFQCGKMYHLTCVDPPMTSRPKRGFAWYCNSCTRKMEEEISSKRGYMLESALPSQIVANMGKKADDQTDKKPEKTEETEKAVNAAHTLGSESVQVKEEHPDSNKSSTKLGKSIESQQDENHKETSGGLEKASEELKKLDKTQSRRHLIPKYEILATEFLEKDKGISFKERREMEEWPWRYLGVHSRLEDAMDLQDRPYPRASSRLGARYQCTGIPDWYEHRVIYYDPAKPVKPKRRTPQKSRLSVKPKGSRRTRSHSPALKLFTEDPLAKKKMPIPSEFAGMDIAKFPGWLQPRPNGYIERGGTDTSTLMWEEPDSTKREEIVEEYVGKCEPIAKRLDINPWTPNFMDSILKILLDHNYQIESSLLEAEKLTREILKEPTFSAEEVERFENSVKVHGDELRLVYKDVKTQPSSMIVRFYYMWKKTKNGHKIWDNYPYRPKNRFKYIKNTELDLDDSEDDAAYSSKKIVDKGVKFRCIYCQATHSTKWFRAPGTVLPKSADETCEGLCFRCCKLWRRYAIEWMSPESILKKLSQKGSGWKWRLESELREDFEDIIAARENYHHHQKRANDANLKRLAEQKTITIDGTKPYGRRHTNARTKIANTLQRKQATQQKAQVKIKTEAEISENEYASSSDINGGGGSSRSYSTDSFSTLKSEGDESLLSSSSKKRHSDTFNVTIPVSKTAKKRKVKTQTRKRGRRDRSNVVINDPLFMQMSSRYESKFNIYNPFTANASDEVPLPQTRSAMKDIAAYWKIYVNSKRRNKAKLAALSKVAKPLFDPGSRPCCVCREYGSLNEMLICSNCGLNVHASCYGVDLSQYRLENPSYMYKWHCDPCSNDIHPLVSTQYVCCMCNARESDHDGAMHGDKESVPDALKRTSNGRWCHVECSVFTRELTFGDAKNMQPILGTQLACFMNIPRTCTVCGGNSGGLIECKACGQAFHVTCCQDHPGIFLGFYLVEDEQQYAADIYAQKALGPNRRIVRMAEDGRTGHIVPVVLCNSHIIDPSRKSFDGNRLYTLRARVYLMSSNYEPDSDEIPLIKAFCISAKKDDKQLHGGELRRYTYEKMLQVYNERTHNGEEIKNTQSQQSVININEFDKCYKCIYCHNGNTIKWHDNSQGAKVCHKCFIRLQKHLPLFDKIPDLSDVGGNEGGNKHEPEKILEKKRTHISISDILS